MSEPIKHIIEKFDVQDANWLAEPFGSGHINDTYKVYCSSEPQISYLLQRVNHHVFKDVEGLMSNLQIVLKHLKGKYRERGEVDVDKKTLTLIPTKDGQTFVRDLDGNYWRMFILLENTRSYDIVENPEQAFAGGQAFGEFQAMLADLDVEELIEILPNFHNIDFRLSNFHNAIKKNSHNRVDAVKDLIDYIEVRQEKMRRVLSMGEKGLIPTRITHNDTKFNNVLLDQDDQVQCVIDLDTVMPGFVAYDFGDAIRTIINKAAEDEPNEDNIQLNIPLFDAYAKGYLSKAEHFLSADEIESLMYGVLLLPYMQAVRFLTDYLEGDHYYKVQYEDHNLVRTKAQLKLVKELEANEEELTRLLYAHVGKNTTEV
ncbi:MAG TPA: aminoglycoside phosphotransferase family protein [Candidatus Sphingobacterium stercoripullorum]|nr:aminoglycoside phosphotransferase family protein [Candidatus Sphingobacterium stercoripullorum]